MTSYDERVSTKIDKQFGRALSILEHESLSSEQVHELRTTCKRLRGLMRLYRQVDKKRVRKMAGNIRDVAREFSSARDADVVRSQLSHWFKAQKYAALKSRLDGLLRQAAGPSSVTLRDARKKVLQTHQEWLALSDVLRTADIEGALLRGRLKAQKAGRKSLKSPSTDGLHAWRKRVKDHYYQWDAIADTPARLRRRAQLKRLGTLLGDIHDLDVFLDFLTQADADLEAKIIIQRICRQRERLLMRVQVLASTLQGVA